ncbi:MAG: glycoside hydrolase family 38 C-terminal domain-containing protein, partial [Candidatus Neomarinimicrobiota bacterium]
NQGGDGEFTRYEIAAEIDLPAFGFTGILVKPCQTPYRLMGSLRTGPASAANEFLAIAIESNGTLTLTDKITGETYRDLLTFEDKSEIGSGWFHSPTVADEFVLSSASPAQVSVMHDGPHQVTFKVALTLNVPLRYDSQQERRSAAQIDLPITNYITLRKNSTTVEIETVIDNRAEDHCLRLLLPTDIGAKTYLSQHPFDFVERDIRLNPETARWQEVELTEKPFQHMQAVGQGKRGLAFLSGGGLHEGGVRDDQRRTMRVTLLRSFRRTFLTAGEHDGLELGEIVHRFALMPFTGELNRVDAMQKVQELQAGLHTRQSGKISSGYPRLTGNQSSQSYIRMQDNHLILSAIKAAENGDGLIVRLWNPSDEKRSETLEFFRKPKSVVYTQLSEDDLPTTIKPNGNTVSIEAGARKIVTVRVRF